MQRVGIIGLGKMGLPIARNLMERGFPVVGYRRSGSAELAAAGGTVAGSPAEVARQCEVLISILPDGAAVESAVCGERGTLSTLIPGTVHLEMSTIDPEHKGRIRAAVQAYGGELLDSPISGGPMMLGPRRTTTFVSGPDEAVAKVRPVLDAIGPSVHTGAFGTGSVMKYISMMLMAVHTVAAAEAIVLARHAGLDLDLVQRTLDSSIASSAVLAQRGPMMRSRTFSPAPGPVQTLHEILEQVARRTTAAGLSTPVFSSAKAVFDKAMADGWAELDIASVHDQISGQSVLDPGPDSVPDGAPRS
jgi:3-hydroxyisobutyrate dehydrogenase